MLRNPFNSFLQEKVFSHYNGKLFRITAKFSQISAKLPFAKNKKQKKNENKTKQKTKQNQNKKTRETFVYLTRINAKHSHRNQGINSICFCLS